VPVTARREWKMQLLVIGLGQCGSHIADEFARMNRRARLRRRLQVLTGVFAVNTDLADLSSLSSIKADYRHRILIGGRKTAGHGVGKMNELGAQIAREDADKIIDAMRETPRFHDSDAFLLIAGAAGGTGSGALPVISQVIKERYLDKPIYNLIVLPFEHEEHTEERTIYNTATCLKSCSTVADAIFLVDNQRYVDKEASSGSNLDWINQQTVEPFYNILCAGEEKRAKHLGTRVIDAGDVKQTLSGWTMIGHGRRKLPYLKLTFWRSSSFREKSATTDRGIEAMDKAISELSFECNPADAARALYLIAAPSKEISLSLIKELGEHMKTLAPDAVIREGDYPRVRNAIDVSVILSEMRDVEKVKRYYAEATNVASRAEQRQKQVDAKLEKIDDAGKDVPSLTETGKPSYLSEDQSLPDDLDSI
jgi:cell division GTPase FtsZ